MKSSSTPADGWGDARTTQRWKKRLASLPPVLCKVRLSFEHAGYLTDYPGGRSVLSCALGLNCVYSAMGLIP